MLVEITIGLMQQAEIIIDDFTGAAFSPAITDFGTACMTSVMPFIAAWPKYQMFAQDDFTQTRWALTPCPGYADQVVRRLEGCDGDHRGPDG